MLISTVSKTPNPKRDTATAIGKKRKSFQVLFLVQQLLIFFFYLQLKYIHHVRLIIFYLFATRIFFLVLPSLHTDHIRVLIDPCHCKNNHHTAKLSPKNQFVQDQNPSHHHA